MRCCDVMLSQVGGCRYQYSITVHSNRCWGVEMGVVGKAVGVFMLGMVEELVASSVT